MATHTSTQLAINTVYTRDQLREKFGITDATLNNGIFKPKDTSSVWLFVTEEKTPDRVQYTDHLEGDTLLMQGQTEGRTDHLIRDQATNDLELLVFHRSKKYENDGAGFRYLGPFHYIRSLGNRPTSFVLMRFKENGRFAYGGKPSWFSVLQAVQRIGKRATIDEIKKYVLNEWPNFEDNFGQDLGLLSVNREGRDNYGSVNHENRRSDSWNPHDALFQPVKGRGAAYELYDPNVHGVWELIKGADGKFRPKKVETDDAKYSLATAAIAAEAEKAFDADDETDARQKVLRSIVVRQGQPKFRRMLLAAYEGKCAVTSCAVKSVLEAAHIKPYLGDHTHDVTNGLLLRADIHTLFDLGHLRIQPLTLVIEVSQQAIPGYGEFDNAPLQLPAESMHHPDTEALSHHYQACKANFGL